MNLKEAAAREAVRYVRDGMTLGLGTGSTAFYAVIAVGELVRQGCHLQAVATSKATAEQAQSLGIPLLGIDEVTHVDLDIDGVDEIDPQFNAVKGGGGALFREKVIAEMAAEVIWIMDESKPVRQLGAFPLAVEIAPYGSVQLLTRMQARGWRPQLRGRGDQLFATDNGNFILDLHLEQGYAPAELAAALKGMTGVLEHGLFLNTCRRMIVGTPDGARTVENTEYGRR
jgi:ribose 5-phosphate isomerase A